MSLTANLTVNDILSRVGTECGLAYVDDPHVSTDQAYIQLKSLLQVSGEELVLVHSWEFLSLTFTVETELGGEGIFDLPDDFISMVDGSGWNETTTTRLIGPLSPQNWRRELIDVTTVGDVYAFRLMRGELHILPKPPPAGQVISFEYASQGFVGDALTRVRKDTFDSGKDIILFDRTLITRMLKVKWLEAKGFATTAAQASLNQVFDNLVGKDKGGEYINVGKPPTGARLLDGRNVPDNGFG